MKAFLRWCMLCEEKGLPPEYGRIEDPKLTEDRRSHGVCPEHGPEYKERNRKQMEEYKRRKGQK